ncbi:MAG: S8 family serine peptidase [Anaerolineae bacterium]|nr:S8 family serine peptidase [Anaerolineae bacterium]
MRRWFTILTIGFIVVLGLSTIRVSASEPPAALQVKVAPQVWATAQSAGKTDFLVILAGQADLSAAESYTTKEAKTRFVYETLWQYAQVNQQEIRRWLDDNAIPYHAFYITNALHVEGTAETIAALANRTDVARIIPNPKVRLPEPVVEEQRAPSDTNGIEWNISRINAPQVWALGYTGQDIVIAGQDTGYQWDHPAIKSQYRGWDGETADHNYNWHDAIHTLNNICPADSPVPCDDHGHGTHTMGSIVGDDGGQHRIGVAPGAKWIGCRNMDSGVGTPATYMECFEFFLAPYPLGGTPAEGRPDMAPDVINNSWTCPPYEGCDWDTLQDTVEAVRAAGIMVVASAGNSGPTCQIIDAPPALYDATYTIGATNDGDSIANFSSRGVVIIDGSQRMKPDISAPGDTIYSSVLNNSYGTKSGTSMAAPHVAGAIALLWSAMPELKGQLSQTEEILNGTTLPRYSAQCGDPENTIPNSVYGWGRLDIGAAIQYVLTAQLSGTVKNHLDTPLDNVAVTAVSGTETQWTAYSNVQGVYSLTLLPGTYSVTASTPGYIPASPQYVTITKGHTTTLDIQLDPCRLAENLEFAYSPLMPYPGDTVIFTATSEGGTQPLTYTWELMPGTLTTGATLTHTYAAHGNYPALLTATNCAGSVSVTRVITVVAPVLEVSPQEINAILKSGEKHTATLTISNTGNLPLDWSYEIMPPQEWLTVEHSGTLWQPLAPQTQQELGIYINTTELSQGFYTTTLRINSNSRPTPNITIPINLSIGCIAPTAVHIAVFPNRALQAGEGITLTANITGPGTYIVSPPLTYIWTLGDGTTAHQQTITHTYPLTHTTQTYTVTLGVENYCTAAPVTDYRRITVQAYQVYLPLILRE